MKINEKAEKIITILYENGYEAYLVGGSTRNYLMGNTQTDIDITTIATPEELERVFKDYKVIKTGLKHGTITVILDGEPIEITTYRQESTYSDNRHPDKVLFVRSLSEDLKRRDFTINAIAYNNKDKLIDLFGGQEDIKNKIIRSVGNASERFLEDALRILRALRFSSVLGFEIEKETAAAIFKHKSLLKNISSERIFIELKKMVMGDNFSLVLTKFREVFEEIIPNFKGANIDSLALLVKRCEKDEILKLATLFSLFNTSDIQKILKGLKCDNKSSKLISFLVENKDIDIKNDRIFIKILLNKYGEDYLKYLFSFIGILKNQKQKYENIYLVMVDIIKSNECYLLKHLKINGNDLKNLGFKGSEIKVILENTLLKVIKGELENNRLEILKGLTK